MTDTQVDAFLAVIHSGGFTKAAENLFISESALSRSIRLLEKELGCTLIVRRRGARVLELTAAGKQFLKLAEQWRILADKSKRLPKDQTISTLRVVATESFNASILPPIYQDFLTSDPSLHLIIETLHSPEAQQAVERGLYDIAFSPHLHDSKNAYAVPLFKETIVVVCPRGMLPDGPAHPRQLPSSREIRSSWAPDYQAWGDFWFGQSERSRLNVKTITTIDKFIIYNNMWAFVPISVAQMFAARSPIDIHAVVNAPPERICYALQNRTFQSPVADSFIRAVQAYATALPGIAPW